MTLSTTEIVNAAEFLSQARLGGSLTRALPANLSPETEAEGYAIQDALHDILKRAGYGCPTGHKIGCTTPVMQEFLKIDHPCSGEVFDRTVFRESAKLQLTNFHRVGVECEIAARLGADMPGKLGGYSRESVGDSVVALMGAIEIVDDRYEDYAALPAPTLIGDDFFNAGVVLGAEQTYWRDLDLAAVRGALMINGIEHASGFGSDILGDPLEALAWLANHKVQMGKPLRAGTFVMLGSVVQTVFLESPSTVSVILKGLSEAEVRFV